MKPLERRVAPEGLDMAEFVLGDLLVSGSGSVLFSGLFGLKSGADDS